MKHIFIVLFILLTVSTYSFAQLVSISDKKVFEFPPEKHDRADFSEEMRISRGGQLYDNWWRTTVDAEKPEKDHPLWKDQIHNKRSGYATFRCKECHGWDYKGKDGAYGTGSHYTGFMGVYSAAGIMSLKDLENVLRGATNRDHDFSRYIQNSDIADLALFLRKGLIDSDKIVNNNGIPVKGSINSGKYIFANNCLNLCHGEFGANINFGDDEEHEYIGTVANGNPWELIHKVRAGQPGANMPSAIINKWDEQDLRDLLTYVRTLPQSKTEDSFFKRVMRFMGLGAGYHTGKVPVRHRGYGPRIFTGSETGDAGNAR
jgi:thiosulfate dehydrogenase